MFQYATGSGRVFEPAHVVSVSWSLPERYRNRILAGTIKRQGLEGYQGRLVLRWRLWDSLGIGEARWPSGDV